MNKSTSKNDYSELSISVKRMIKLLKKLKSDLPKYVREFNSSNKNQPPRNPLADAW